MNEFDVVSATWSPAVEVIGAQPTEATAVGGPDLSIDQTGAITMVWSVWEDAGLLQTATVFGARAAPGTLKFKEISCRDEHGMPISCQADPALVCQREFNLSEPGRCGRFHSFDTHPSGRTLIGWNEEECPQPSPGTTTQLASLFRSFE